MVVNCRVEWVIADLSAEVRPELLVYEESFNGEVLLADMRAAHGVLVTFHCFAKERHFYYSGRQERREKLEKQTN